MVDRSRLPLIKALIITMVVEIAISAVAVEEMVVDQASSNISQRRN